MPDRRDYSEKPFWRVTPILEPIKGADVMRIVLLHFELKNWDFWGDVLGPQYLAAELRAKGHEVCIFSVPVETDSGIAERIITYSPGLVGFSLPCPFRERLGLLGKELDEKLPEAHLTCGNRYASDNSEVLLSEYSWLDSVIRGEGELTIVELVSRLEHGTGLEGCLGITFKSEGILVKNPDRELIKDLNTLHFPSRDVLAALPSDRNATFLTGRGCVNNCTFCNSSYSDQKGKVWRGRDPQNVADELEYVSKELGCRNFFFADPSYEEPGEKGKKRIREIAEEIIKRGMEINYGVYFSAHRWGREDLPLLELLKSSGLEYIYVGIEAGTPESLRIFNKRATVEDNYRMLSLVREAGIGVKFGFIMFHPYLTTDELKRSLEFIHQAQIGYSFRCFNNELEVYKGTEMYNMLKKDGYLTGETDREVGNYYWKYKDSGVLFVRKLTKQLVDENTCLQKEISLEYKVISFLHRIKNMAYRRRNTMDIAKDFEERTNKIYTKMNDLNYSLISKMIGLAEDALDYRDYSKQEKEYLKEMEILVKALEDGLFLYGFKAKKANLL